MAGTPAEQLVVIGEDGGHRVISGTLENSRAGIESKFKSMNSRGYIAKMVGEGAKGTRLEMVETVNGPTVPFDTVKENWARRQTKGSSNMIFRNRGHG